MQEEEIYKKIAKSIGWGDGKIRYATKYLGEQLTIILDQESDMDKALNKLQVNGLGTRCISNREIIISYEEL
jgi:hypothetical protein